MLAHDFVLRSLNVDPTLIQSIQEFTVLHIVIYAFACTVEYRLYAC